MQPRFKKNERVFYVHIPAKRDLVTGTLKPEKARPATDLVDEHYWPHQGSGLEIIYKLVSRGKKINQKELYSNKDDCQAACDKINEELSKVSEIKPKKIEKSAALNTMTT